MLQNIVQWMGKADDFFKEKPLPKEEFKRAGVMTKETVTVDLFQPKVKGCSEIVSSENVVQQEKSENSIIPSKDIMQQTQDVAGKGEDQDEDFQSLLDILQSLEFQPKPAEEPVEVPQNLQLPHHNPQPKPMEVLENASTPASITTKECVSTSPIYEPLVESITPVKVKKDLKIKNPGFKRHRSFPYPSQPPYKQ